MGVLRKKGKKRRGKRRDSKRKCGMGVAMRYCRGKKKKG